MKKIYILGSVNTDLSITADRFPRVGETLVGRDFVCSHGGKGLNQAIAAARLGGTVKMCACVGDDVFGEEAIKLLNKEGVDTECIIKRNNLPTGSAMITLVNGQNSIIISGGANQSITVEQISAFLKDANEGDIFLTQLENNIYATGKALALAKSKKMFVVLNPAPANKKIVPFLQYCDLITPNETEVDLMGGEDNLKKLVPNILITLGPKGYKIINKEVNEVFPCIKVEVVDTVAAGDTLCGGLVAELAAGASLLDAARFGSKAASISCTKRGAEASIPEKELVEQA